MTIMPSMDDLILPQEAAILPVYGQLHLEIHGTGQPIDPRFKYFTVDEVLSYVGFCDDFGPMSLGSVFHFCNIVDEEIRSNPGRQIALRTRPDKRSLTNAVFMLGSYLIMRLDSDENELESCFQSISHRLLSYRDVSPGKQNFHLYVQDCWGGLLQAKKLGWVDFDRFDVDEYTHYDDPLNADLHEVVPNKFIAMRGPKDLPGCGSWRDVVDEDGQFSHRDFSPTYFAGILDQFNVQAVVRLNAAEYDDAAFETAGIAVADLRFDDCTAPPVDVAAKFMLLAEGVPGALAVHCKAGLGRTGTLIALYMMKHCGFTARQAMGWLRVVRPGSVIGEQQHFLCDKEPVMRRSGEAFRAKAAAAAAAGTASPAAKFGGAAGDQSPMEPRNLDKVRRLIAAVGRSVDSRISAHLAAPGGPASVPANRTPPARDARAGGRNAAAEALGAHVLSATNSRVSRRAAPAMAAAAMAMASGDARAR